MWPVWAEVVSLLYRETIVRVAFIAIKRLVIGTFHLLCDLISSNLRCRRNLASWRMA